MNRRGLEGGVSKVPPIHVHVQFHVSLTLADAPRQEDFTGYDVQMNPEGWGPGNMATKMGIQTGDAMEIQWRYGGDMMEMQPRMGVAWFMEVLVRDTLINHQFVGHSSFGPTTVYRII